MHEKLLLVEDELSHQLIIRKALGPFYDVDVAGTMQEALDKIGSQSYDLFILDIMLPDGDGYDLCSQIKMDQRFEHRPIVFLTSKEDVNAKVLGFSLGADDYIVKPCEPIELKARIDSKLKRHKIYEKAGETFCQGVLHFELDRQSIYTENDSGKNWIELTPLEFKLAYYLAKNVEQVMSRAQILGAVWGDTTNVLERSVDTYVAALRKKLGPYGSCIKSVHGVGYKFIAPQEERFAS
ncbi:MAG: response regulator transcription factor [Bdellovibrionales bacterium]